MKPAPDDELTRALDALEPPAHDPGFWPRVDRQLAAARRDMPREPAGPRRWLRPAFAAGAAALACALLALGLAGLPGTAEVGPQPAGAVGRLLARVDAGLARVRTVQGTMITAGADGRPQAAPFAVTARGDAYADQPEYVPSRVILGQRRTYRRDLADMRAGRQPWNGRQLRTDRAVLVRMEAAGDAATRVSTSRTWYVDAFTGMPLGIGYSRSVNSDGRYSAMPEPGGPDAANVWGLSSAVRVAIASDPDSVTLADTTYEGRPATKAVVGVGGGSWVAIIDREYGLVLRFDPSSGPSSDEPYVAFRIVDLRVNEDIPRPRFTVPAVFSLDASFKPIPLGRHDPGPYTDDAGYSTTGVRQAAATAGTQVFLPAHVPSGFRLWPLATDYRTTVAFSYVHGIGTIQLGESDREQYPTSERTTWMDMSTGATAMARGLVTQTRGGALDGWPMIVTVPQLADPRTADWWNAGIDGGTDTTQVSLRGVLARAQYLSMVSSMRPVAGWSLFDRPAYQYGRALLLVVAGLTVAAVLVEVVAASRRRRGRPRAGLRTAEVLALAGCVALAVSLTLPWYRLHSAARHADYALSGGSIRFVVAALACASGAAVVALIRAAMGGWRVPARESVLLATFALFALALLIDVRVVQPDQARFTLGDPSMPGSLSPTPWFGMLVGFSGVALLLLAAVFSRERRKTIHSG